MSEEIGVIAKLGGVILAALGSAFGFGKYNSCVVKKKELYNPDGSQIYFTSEKASNEFSKVDDKFDKIIGFMREQNEESKSIREFMGSVKQYMENHRR